MFTFQDAETFLTYNWIQEEIFQSLLSNLPRALFFKLCRMIHYRYSESYTGTYHLFFYEIPILFQSRPLKIELNFRIVSAIALLNF